jgi:hypothetical protein
MQQHLAGDGAYSAVSGLFFLYGTRLSPSAVWLGLTNRRLLGVVFPSPLVLMRSWAWAPGGRRGRRRPRTSPWERPLRPPPPSREPEPANQADSGRATDTDAGWRPGLRERRQNVTRMPAVGSKLVLFWKPKAKPFAALEYIAPK